MASRKALRTKRNLHRKTEMLHCGFDPHMSVGSLTPPIYTTSTYVAPTAAEAKRSFSVALGIDPKTPSNPEELFYSRITNPNTEIAEARFCALDGAEECALFGAGMAAIDAILWTFCDSRGESAILCNEPLYGGTTSLIKQYAKKLNISVHTFSSAESLKILVRGISKRCAVPLIFIETPTNPTLHLIDIEKCAKIAHNLGALLVVDNTFLSSLYQKPFKYGADIVIYSVTKYHGGHSDLFGGAVLGSEKIISQIKARRSTAGSIMHPYTAVMLTRSLETYESRVIQHAKNAEPVAHFLANHQKIKLVRYLGRLNGVRKQGNIFKKQCLSPGAMMAFELKAGGEENIFNFLDNLEIFKLAVSFGGTHSLICHPATTTHLCVSGDELSRMGLTELIRISVGLEDPFDLIWDLEQALKVV